MTATKHTSEWSQSLRLTTHSLIYPLMLQSWITIPIIWKQRQFSYKWITQPLTLLLLCLLVLLLAHGRACKRSLSPPSFCFHRRAALSNLPYAACNIQCYNPALISRRQCARKSSDTQFPSTTMAHFIAPRLTMGIFFFRADGGVAAVSCYEEQSNSSDIDRPENNNQQRHRSSNSVCSHLMLSCV